MGSTCFEFISITPDDILEDDEFFTITIESRDPRLIVSISQAQIEIEDRNSKKIPPRAHYVVNPQCACTDGYSSQFVCLSVISILE